MVHPTGLVRLNLKFGCLGLGLDLHLHLHLDLILFASVHCVIS